MKGPLTILIAEDDDGDLILLKRAFDKVSPQTRLMVVKDGEDALRYLKRTSEVDGTPAFPFPQVILLDLAMPRRGGFEVIELVRSDPRLRKLPIIVMSGESNSEEVARAYELGANAYFLKPNDPEELYKMVASLLPFGLDLPSS